MWIGALGPIAVRTGGSAVALGGSRQTAALAALVLFVGRPLSADQLVDALWPDSGPPSARRTLQSHLSRLRSNLGGEAVIRDRSGYQLSAAVSTDVVEFEQHLGRAATADPADALVHWDAARSLWRDDPYPELGDWPPAAIERARLGHLREAADEDRLEVLLGLVDPASLVAEASVLVSHQPLRERRWALLMWALYRSGRQPDALRAFQDARSHLIDAVGVEPGPELRALESAMLAQDPGLDAPSLRIGDRAPSRSAGGSTALPAAPALPANPDEDRVPRFLQLLRDRDPLVGREADLDRCIGHWEMAQQRGQPAVVVVRGEPGIGKTRLAAELVAHAIPAGETVYLARCREGLAVPYAPLAEAFRGASPGLTAALAELGAGATSPEQVAMARRRVGEAFGRALQSLAATAPVVLMLDDAQWADGPTVEALGWAIEHELTAPVLVVLTVRANEIATDPTGGVGALLAELPRLADTLDVPLAGVDRAAAGRIVGHRVPSSAHPIDIDWLFAESGGSPLYLIELARQPPSQPFSAADPPPSINDIVRRRVDLLPSATRDLVVAGAVLGEEFDIRVAAAMVSQSVGDALDNAASAVDAQLLYRQADTAFRFSHGVTRRAVEAVFATSRLLALHWVAGTLLEGSSLVRPEEVADHLLTGAAVGDAGRAARAVLVATSSARDQLDPAEGLRLLERATELLSAQGGADSAELADVLLASAALRARQGSVGEAKHAALRAVDLARALGDPTLFARAAVGYAELVNAGEPDDLAPASCHEALALIGSSDSQWSARVLSALANYHSVVLSDATSGQPFADRALAAAAERDPDSRAEALWAQACALLGAADVTARAGVMTALAECAAPGSRRHVEAVRLTAHTSLELGDRRGYERSVEALGRLGEDHGSWDALVWAHIGRGQVTLMEGRLVDSEQAARALDEVKGGSIYAWSLATMQDCFRLYERLELGSFAPTLEVLAVQIDLPGVRAMLVQALMQAGELDRAASELELLGRDGFASLRPEQTYTGALAMLIDAAVALDRPFDVQALADRLAPYTGLLVVSAQGAFSLGAVDRYLATAPLVAGDEAEAARLLAAAAELEARAGATLGAAYTAVAEQRLRAATGSTVDGSVVDALRRQADRLGLVRLSAQVDALADGGAL